MVEIKKTTTNKHTCDCIQKHNTCFLFLLSQKQHDNFSSSFHHLRISLLLLLTLASPPPTLSVQPTTHAPFSDSYTAFFQIQTCYKSQISYYVYVIDFFRLRLDAIADNYSNHIVVLLIRFMDSFFSDRNIKSKKEKEQSKKIEIENE